MKPEYFKERVGLYVALAPVVRLDHSTSEVLKAASAVSPATLTRLIKLFGAYNLSARGGSSATWGALCHYMKSFCVLIAEGFGDFEPDIDNRGRLDVDQAHTPSGCGWRNLVHYAQISAARKF